MGPHSTAIKVIKVRSEAGRRQVDGATTAFQRNIGLAAAVVTLYRPRQG